MKLAPERGLFLMKEDFSEKVFDDMMAEYKIAEQMIKFIGDPEVKRFNEEKKDYLKKLLEKTGIIFDGGDRNGGSGKSMEK